MFQISTTYKCNFECAHCFQNASPRKKGQIDRNTYLKALKFGSEYEYSLNLLGGEIFMHKDFAWQIKQALWNFEEIRIVTNGALLIDNFGELTEKGQDLFNVIVENYDKHQIYIHISDDYEHDRFREGKKTAKFIRNCLQDHFFDYVTFTRDEFQRNYYIPLGRAAENGYWSSGSQYAICSDGETSLSANYKGEISLCCNEMQIIGNVLFDSYSDIEERIERYNWKGFNDISDCQNCKKYVPEYKKEFAYRYKKQTA